MPTNNTPLGLGNPYFFASSEYAKILLAVYSFKFFMPPILESSLLLQNSSKPSLQIVCALTSAITSISIFLCRKTDVNNALSACVYVKPIEISAAFFMVFCFCSSLSKVNSPLLFLSIYLIVSLNESTRSSLVGSSSSIEIIVSCQSAGTSNLLLIKI